MSNSGTRSLWVVVVAALAFSGVACGAKVVITPVLPPLPPPPPPPPLVAQMCHVDRQDCLAFDGQGRCTSTQHVIFSAVGCGKTAQDVCSQFCVNAGLPTVPYVTPCVSTVLAGAPTNVAFCNAPTTPQNFDLSCTDTGRECNSISGNSCSGLATELSTGTRTQCIDTFQTSGFDFCANLLADNGMALLGSRVTSATFTPHSGPCATTSALTASDMSYGIPAGAPVPVAVAGQNLTFTTSGGRLVVTYACDNDGEFCHPYQVKDFWLGLNPTTINGMSFSNIQFANAGLLPFRSDGTLDTAGPGFRMSATINGTGNAATYYKPQVPIKFTGSLGSAPFTLGATFDLPVEFGDGLGYATAHVNMNLSGSTLNSSGTPGGVQIACGSTSAIGTFVVDKDFSNGAERTRNNIIDLSGAIAPAPMTVYQNQRYASPYSYTIPGFTPGSSHKIRLHFAETNPANNAPNKRKFSVAINGTTQISNLDLFATVGMNKAYIKEFTLNANSSGQYVLSFTASLDSATISGIEVL